MARMYDRVQRQHEAKVAARKRELFADLGGTVLEIGPGTGVNFRHYPEAVKRWIGIEPNRHMHAALQQAGRPSGIAIELRGVGVEGMDVGDATVDAVVSTLVLCSVPDPAVVLRDVARVLRPGGRFVFLEHVAAPRGSRLRLAQRLFRPVWRYIADGCRPDRELAAAVHEAGFASVTIEEFTLPREAVPGIVSPHIAGTATR